MKLYSNPEKDFNERDDLEPNDFNHITNVYETEKDSVKIFVALGQKKESSDDLVYYPIYLILKTKQVKKIGIIEGDFTIDWQSKQIKLQPNYFTFVTKAYLTQVALSNLNELESEITNWINKLYNNSKSFDIQTSMPRTSDSLFHAIINSGITTDSVEMLRRKLAEQPTEATFKQFKDTETNIEFNNPFIDDEILKKMADCSTLEDLREYIQSPNFWPINEVAGIDFPKMFDVDMIIFFESNKAVQCLPLTGRDKIVLLNYSVDEKNRFYFDLVKYEGKRTLSLAELEQTPMYLACRPEPQQGGGGGKKYAADNLVFVISNGNGNHQTTKIKLTPGRFPGESIELVDIPAFSALDEIPQWRNKLATHWPAPFSLNNFRWASVEHFLQAYKFEYAHPEFFQLFSLNSGSEISKSAEMAKFVADIATKEEEEQDASAILNLLLQHNNHLNPVLIEKELQVVPRRIPIDPLYKEKKKQWKFDAQYAKFNQNEEMRNILCATKHAKLVYFQHTRPPKAAKDLMRIRQILCVP
jgi:hypothetical protein